MLHLKSGEYLGSVNSNWHADGLLISVAAYPVPVFEGWHCHENHHISFIIQGGNNEQRKGREKEILPGEVVSYRSGELHRNCNTQTHSRNINLEIKSGFFSRYGLDADVFSTGAFQGDAKFTILKIYKECQAGDDRFSSAVHSLLLSLLRPGDPAPACIPRWVTMLREVLNDRWDDNIPLQELARLVQVHPVTISKYFPRYFHCTLGEYIRKLRIEKALSLMRTAKLPLTAIAHQCGFFDQSHFIRTFKDMTGFLPGGYKKIGG